MLSPDIYRCVMRRKSSLIWFHQWMENEGWEADFSSEEELAYKPKFIWCEYGVTCFGG